MDFPQCISLTLTNTCNLRCKMCGQWSKNGYLHSRKKTLKQALKLEDWRKIIDELSAHHIPSLLLRGGEPFLFPGIIELLDYINQQGIFVSIDTNGTLLKDFAADILRIGKIHLTISIDGPEDIHDSVRGVKGSFAKIKAGLTLLNKLEKDSRKTISKSLNFTISPYSLKGLGQMPEVARSLSIKTLCIVPYYYFSEAVGRTYAKELKEHFHCSAFSWSGFHHEHSGIDIHEFHNQHKTYLANLNGIHNFPYMDFSEADYQNWFSDSFSPVGASSCTNIEKLLDIQPTGEANFCVDFPDYTLGNVRESTIQEIWNSKRAEDFRAYRRKKPLAVCFRCGAKYMSEIGDKEEVH